MDKSVLGLLGGASALALVSGGGALAAPTPTTEASVQPAQSFAELLDPIPNAVNTLRAQEESGSDLLHLAQVVVTTPSYHHHHHHHHHWRWRHHHHHHHHHHHVVIPVPVPQ